MRSLLIACAVMLVAATASAAVPDATLAAFGLGGMQQMTDAQGMNVRGMGFACVSGGGYAAINVDVNTCPVDVNANACYGTKFDAAGRCSAFGISANVAVVGGAIGGCNPTWVVLGSASGGFAFAKAH
jgi:hypothetical protein